MSTVFHKIVAGEIPCHRVYEDAQVLAFLDISPLSRGHILVIPKQAAATLDELPEEYARPSAAPYRGSAGRSCARREQPPTIYSRTTGRSRIRRSSMCISISSRSIKTDRG